MLYPSSIGGMYADLYTDADMFEYLHQYMQHPAKVIPDYYISLQGITAADRLLWHIRSRHKDANVTQCLEFIFSLPLNIA